MYGSDYPIYTWMYSEMDWLDVFFQNMDKEEIAFSEDQLKDFLSRNALRFLNFEQGT